MRDSLKRSIYLLTVWQERLASPDRPAVWRISLEDVRTGERRGFAKLEQLLIFLEKQMVDDIASVRVDNDQQEKGETNEY